MSQKKGFIIFYDSYALVNRLNNDRAGILFKNLFNFEENRSLLEMDEVTDIVYTSITQYLTRNRVKYEDMCRKRSEAGKKGGRPSKKKESEKQTETKKANAFSEKQIKVNSSDNDNVNDNKTDTVNDNVNKNARDNTPHFEDLRRKFREQNTKI